MEKLARIKGFFFRHKLLSAFLVVYLLFGIVISLQIGEIQHASYKSLGEENSYPQLISDEDFRRLRSRHGAPCTRETNPDCIEKFYRTPIFTFHWFVGAKSRYYYWRSARLEAENQYSGSWEIPVTITSKFEDGRWKVVKVYEAP